MRDKLYMPTLRFALKFKLPVLGFSIMTLLITGGAIGGGIIKTTFFPVISSDQVNINLNMPQGINPDVTDSLLKVIEIAAWEANEEFTEKQTGNLQVI